MAESSRLQGLHQVAKKLMMRGRPALERVSVLTFFPSKLRNIMAGSCDFPEGCCANATKLVSRTRKVNRIFFIEKGFWREMWGCWVGYAFFCKEDSCKEGLSAKDLCKEDLSTKDSCKEDLSTKDSCKEGLSAKDSCKEDLSTKRIHAKRIYRQGIHAKCRFIMQ